MKKDSIENLLHSYIRKIDYEGFSNKNDERIEAENLFCRLFIEIFNWRDLKNINYSEPNAAGIDLYSEKKGIAIQVTTIQSSELTKIKDTVKKTLKYHQNKKINGIICFFIKDNQPLKKINENELSKEFGIKVKIRTTQEIIGSFERFPIPEKKLKILEILKQVTSAEFKGIDSLNKFEPYQNRKISKYSTPENLIYFSITEKRKINEISTLFNNDKVKEYAILGNPCSGKSTFANTLIKKLNAYFKVYYLDLSSPELNNSEIMSDINQLQYYHSVLLIENVHENIKLFEKIQERVKRFDWLKALFISRYYNSYREEDENSIISIFKNVKTFRYNPDIQFEEKVDGIINNRTFSLTEQFPKYDWFIGNFKKVLKNTDRNLLKLNIAFEVWISLIKKGKSINFDEINTDNIYSYFYTNHKLRENDEELLFLYSYLYKNDIPFLRNKSKYDEFNLLKTKGLILNYSTSDYYYFPHKDYANLIYESIKKEKDLNIDNVFKYLTNYLLNYKTESKLNIVEILLKLNYSNEFEIVKKLLNQNITLKIITSKFYKKIRYDEVFQLYKIFFSSFDYLDNEIQFSYFELFKTYYIKNKLQLYILKDYSIYSNLSQIANLLNTELGDIYKTLRLVERANTNSIVELTMRVSKKQANPETVNRILNSFDFSEWLLMIEKLPTLSNITNSLSELNTSPLGKKLLKGLLQKLNIEDLKIKSRYLKTVQIAKSIAELKKIDISLGTDFSNKLIENFVFNSYSNSTNLSDFTKSLSDLNSIIPKDVDIELTKSFKNNEFIKILEKETSISNISGRLPELNKIITSNKNLFSELIAVFFESKSFLTLLQNEKSIKNLLLLYNILFVNKVEINEVVQNKILIITKKLILDLEYDDTLYHNLLVLNIPELKLKLEKGISSDLLNKTIESSKFTIMDSLFRVLIDINKEKTIKAVNNADLEIFIKSMSHKELNISQSLEVLFRAKNKAFIDANLNSNLFFNNLLDKYLLFQKEDQYQYNRLNFGDFLKAFEFSLKINKKIAIMHFEYDFLKKLKITNNKNLRISSLFQFIKKIQISTEYIYNEEIKVFLNLYKSNFINNIKNEDIQKTTSGLVELTKCNFHNYVDELIYDARNTFKLKLKQVKGNEKIEKKVYGDLNLIAINKSRFLLDWFK